MKNCNVRDYGATGDGKTLDTLALQAAIDDCSSNGGGTVLLEEGSFLSGMIRLKDGVDLHIERDAVLLGSTDAFEYPEIESEFWHTEYAPRFNRRCFIYAEGAKDIAISGRGAIDCQGEAYIYRLPEEEAMKAMWPYKRLPHPELPGDEDVDPFIKRFRSLSPARAVLFMGCKNVFVEDVTLRNLPAGWGYWICDCDDVHFAKATIDANVLYPNNDGIHINCSRNVTVSDCNINAGDDAIIIRAYSAPLKENAVCERVAVTNCNIRSHSSGIRVGWFNDGVIRNCSFTNLNMTDTTVGIDVYLPECYKEHRGSDEGFEDTLIENLSFSHIIMDRVFYEPVRIQICEGNRCEGIRNLYFSDIHAFSCNMPAVIGRTDCHPKNIYFTNCHFRQMKRELIPDEKNGPHLERSQTVTPVFRHVDNLVLNDTVFDIF